MKKDRILNPELISAIARVGHTEYLVVADAGLPIQPGVPVVDLSLVHGVPSYEEVLRAVAQELVVESCIVATEMQEKNAALLESTKRLLPGCPMRFVPHSELKALVGSARAVVRTGETTPFANVVLVAGVNF